MTSNIHYINYKNKILKNKFANYVFFCDENLKFDVNNYSFLKINQKTLNINFEDLSKKNFLEFYTNEKQKIFFLKIKKNISSIEIEKVGSNFFKKIGINSKLDLIFLNDNIQKIFKQDNDFLNHFILGLKMQSYSFDIYKSERVNKRLSIYILSKDLSKKNKLKRIDSLIEGVNFTKDLVSEPGNILNPDEYVKRIMNLKKIGLKIKILDKKKLKKLGMNALLGVGQGSAKGSYLAIIQWDGLKKKKQTISFCRKRCLF